MNLKPMLNAYPDSLGGTLGDIVTLLGRKELKELFDGSGYTVKDIQKILHLSCPQPIYRWFKGSILPSVDHLYVLSRLLKVRMEDLLVPKCEYSIVTEKLLGEKRLYEYWKRLCIKKCA